MFHNNRLQLELLPPFTDEERTKPQRGEPISQGHTVSQGPEKGLASGMALAKPQNSEAKQAHQANDKV